MSQLKRCTKCKNHKLLSEFSPHKGGKFNVHSICKPCNSVRHKEYKKRMAKIPQTIDDQIFKTKNQIKKLETKLDQLLKSKIHVGS